MAKKRTKVENASDQIGDAGTSRKRTRTLYSIPATPDVPGWVPPVLYGVLTIFLFREFVFSDQMLVGNDTMGLGYAARSLYAEALTSLGRVPGWAPHILGGTPFLEALSAGDSLYPPSVLLLLLTETYRALGWKLVLHVFLAGLFMFGWIRSIGGSKAAALLAGAAYQLAPFFVSFVRPGHDGKIFVIALAPLLFWAVERHFRRPTLASVAGIGLTVALILYTTHFQMAYFLFGGVGLYAIFRAVQFGRGSAETGEASPRVGGIRFALFIVAALLGASGAAYQFVPAAQYVTEYSRRIQTTGEAAGSTGRAWSSSYSMNPEEVMSIVVPEFPGNNAGGGAEWTDRTYWGRNFAKDNHEYAGLVMLLLASVSFLGAARPGVRWFMVGLGLLALGFGLGTNTPIWGLFYALVPGIDLFRAPGMVSFLFGFAVITLGALGFDRAFEVSRRGESEEARKLRRVLWIGTGTVVAIALLIASGIFTSLWTSIVYRSISEPQLGLLAAHLPNIVRGAGFAVLIAAATAGVIWALGKSHLSPRVAAAALILVVAVDEARVDAPFIQTLDFYQWSQADPNVQTILDREQQSTDPFRLHSFATAGQDVGPAMHGIELAAGHHPNDLSRYRELIGMVGSGEPVNLRNSNVRRILNVKYVLWPDVEYGPAPPGALVLSRTQFSGGQPFHTLIAENGLARARLVGSAVVKSDAEAVDYILNPAHNPAVEVVLAEAPAVQPGGGAVIGTVTWEERSADRHRLSVQSDKPAVLVIADNWFPAWRATVNGEEVPVLRAYHSLRAVSVPAGSSTVEMWYESTLLARSFSVSALVLLGLIGAGLFGTYRDRRTARDAPSEREAAEQKEGQGGEES
jgi:hypothetical protein